MLTYTIGSRLCFKYDVRCMMDGCGYKERNEEWRNFLGKMLQYMASITEVVEFGELGGVREYKTGLIPKKEERRLGYGWGKQNILSAPPYIINKSAAAQTSYNNYLKDTKEIGTSTRMQRHRYGADRSNNAEATRRRQG